jgi:uncharacterized membrane protein
MARKKSLANPEFDFASSPSGRSLQMLKAVCVAGMVVVHAFFFAATHRGRLLVPDTNPLFLFVKNGMSIGIFPLLLPFTAGCALRVRWSNRDGTLRRVPWKEAVAQAAGVASIGYLMNVLAAGWYPLWSWNVLQLVGVSMIAIALLERAGSYAAVALAAVAVLLSSDWLHMNVPFYEGPGWMKVLFGDPTYYHTWPVFPWFALIAFGWLLAECTLRFRDAAWFRYAILVFGGLAAISAVGNGNFIPPFDPRKLIGPRIFIAPSMAAIGVIGWASLLTAGLSLIAARIEPARYGFIRCFSGGIFWIYLIHTIVGARFYEAVIKPIDRVAIFANPFSAPALVLLAGYPAALLALSWAVGFLVVRFLHEKRLRIGIVRRKNSVRRMTGVAA